MTIPYVRTFAVGPFTSMISGANFSTPAVVAPFAAVVTAVQYVPASAVLASTNVANTARTWTLYNRGGSASSGTGAVILARGALTSLSASQTAFSTGLIDNVAASLPLNSVTTSLTVAAGEILEWESSFSGSTGGIDPGGLLYVTLSRI